MAGCPERLGCLKPRAGNSPRASETPNHSKPSQKTIFNYTDRLFLCEKMRNSISDSIRSRVGIEVIEALLEKAVAGLIAVVTT